MAKIKIDVDDIHESSLDISSADSEYLVDEGTFGGSKSEIMNQPYLDTNENSASYNFRDISSSVAYKIIPMTGEDTTNTMASDSPSHEYYVISNPVEVFGTPATQKKAITRRDPIQVKAVTAKKRDDKRRATHNEVERRRRDKINSWISKLGALVPPAPAAPDAPSKGGILARACDHITHLTRNQAKLEKLEVENEKLVLEILRLNQELTEVRRENSSMRDQLADNCIVRPKGEKP